MPTFYRNKSQSRSVDGFVVDKCCLAPRNIIIDFLVRKFSKNEQSKCNRCTDCGAMQTAKGGRATKTYFAVISVEANDRRTNKRHFKIETTENKINIINVKMYATNGEWEKRFKNPKIKTKTKTRTKTKAKTNPTPKKNTSFDLRTMDRTERNLNMRIQHFALINK